MFLPTFSVVFTNTSKAEAIENRKVGASKKAGTKFSETMKFKTLFQASLLAFPLPLPTSFLCLYDHPDFHPFLATKNLI
jgi:hypothetical protein